MAVPTYTVTCVEKKLIAPGVYELRFSKPEGFQFKAGQFILFDVPLTENENDIQPRAYSIASTNEENDLLFVVKIKVGGRFSEWLMKKLEIGSTIVMKGPFGLFTLTEKPQHLVFAATGAGIAPFRSQILERLTKNDPRQFDLYFGVRHVEDFFWIREFEEAANNNNNFRLHLCLSGDETSWKGNRGRIQLFIPKTITDPSTTEIYICGAPMMVADIKKLALETWMLPKSNVHAEGYI